MDGSAHFNALNEFLFFRIFSLKLPFSSTTAMSIVNSNRFNPFSFFRNFLYLFVE